MAFVLDDATLQSTVAYQEQQVARRRAHQYLEQLGRGYQWLDRPEDARAAYLEAAELFERKMEETGRHDPGRQLEAGICLLHAGEPDAARAWFTRALQTARGLKVVQLHYLLGDDERTIVEGEALEDPGELRDALVLLARARRDRDVAAARQAREVLVDGLRSERLAPGETSGPSFAGWDAVAESFRVEAELEGRPMPSYREMLEQLGLRPAQERA